LFFYFDTNIFRNIDTICADKKISCHFSAFVKCDFFRLSNLDEGVKCLSIGRELPDVTCSTGRSPLWLCLDCRHGSPA